MKLPQIWLTIVLTVFSFSSSVPAFSQQEPAFPGVQSRVLVSVEPRHGKQVPAVRKEDVTITQGKQRDKVLAWQSVLSPEVGAQVFVLIDDSLSSSEMGSKLNDIRDFISAQPVSVLVGIAYMRNGTALVAQNPTSEHALAAKALRLSIGDGGSSPSPYFALQDLLKRWPQSNSAREVIMITDGIDRFWDGVGLDDPYLNSAIEEAQRGGVVVNALYARGGGHFGHSPWMIRIKEDLHVPLSSHPSRPAAAHRLHASGHFGSTGPNGPTKDLGGAALLATHTGRSRRARVPGPRASSAGPSRPRGGAGCRRHRTRRRSRGRRPARRRGRPRPASRR